MGNHACHKVKLYLTFNFITLVLYLTIKKQIKKIEGGQRALEHAVLIKYFKYTHNITSSIIVNDKAHIPLNIGN